MTLTTQENRELNRLITKVEHRHHDYEYNSDVHKRIRALMLKRRIGTKPPAGFRFSSKGELIMLPEEKRALKRMTEVERTRHASHGLNTTIRHPTAIIVGEKHRAEKVIVKPLKKTRYKSRNKSQRRSTNNPALDILLHNSSPKQKGRKGFLGSGVRLI